MQSRRSIPAVATVLIAALGPGCGSVPAGPLQREAAFGAPADVTDEGGAFRASLSLPFEQHVDAEGTLAIAMPIEGSVPIYCFVWPDGSEIGVTAQRMAQLIFQELTETGHEISDRQIVALEAGVVGDTAYQAILSVFQIRSAAGEGTGVMKVAAANKHGYGLGCNHWDNGYLATFRRVFEELVGSFRVRDPGVEPYYREISEIRIGELEVGVSSTTFRRDTEGDVEVISETSLVLPRSPSELLASYARDTNWSTPDGGLINAFFMESDIETRHTDLALSRSRKDGWQVAGSYQGKPIEAVLDHGGIIHSSLAEALALKHWLAPHGERSTLDLTRWSPGADPTRVIQASYRVDAEDERYVDVEIATGVTMRARRDDDGLARSGSLSVGNVTMLFERVYRHGEL